MCLNIDDKLVDITVSFVYSHYSGQVSTNKEARTIHSPLFNLSSRLSKGRPLFISKRHTNYTLYKLLITWNEIILIIINRLVETL